jgi:hypothetical protein
MNMGITATGIVLIIIALILGAVQHFGMYNIYGDESNKWYFYGIIAVIGVIGILLAAWGAMKKEKLPMVTSPKQ